MRLALRPLLLSTLVVSGLAGPLASSASGDGRVCGAFTHPACTILRAPSPASRPPAFDGPECIVLVGGLGSLTASDDRFFDPLLEDLREEGGYRFIRFGLDPDTLGHRFDPYGAISENALSLRALVVDASRECRSIHVVAHSMGGAVADRAFSMDMAEMGAVATYLPLSSPHNGAFGARAVRLGVGLDETYASVTSSVAQRLRLHDPTKPAVRDLALIHAPLPPRVPTVRQRLVSDLVVIRRDVVDRRADVREYLAASPDQLEGHGGVVRNERVRHVVESTIRAHAVAPEERSVAEVKAAELASRLVDEYWGGVVATAGLALATVAVGSAAGSAARDAAERLGAGDPGGAADIVGSAAGREARRIAEAAPQVAELGGAALALRKGLPAALLAQVVEMARE
jgi:PGAP1-like protein